MKKGFSHIDHKKCTEKRGICSPRTTRKPRKKRETVDTDGKLSREVHISVQHLHQWFIPFLTLWVPGSLREDLFFTPSPNPLIGLIDHRGANPSQAPHAPNPSTQYMKNRTSASQLFQSKKINYRSETDIA